LSEQPLALPDAKGYAEVLVQERGQERTIPEVSGQAVVGWAATKRCLDAGAIGIAQSRGPARSLPVAQASKAVLLESMHPVLDRPGRIAQRDRGSTATPPLRHQQDRMEPMVVTGFRVAPNLVLKREDHLFAVANAQRLHGTRS